MPRPFVKWPGGKTYAVDRVLARLPDEMGTYYEPMVGGGAVLFALARAGRFERAVVSDVNPELFNVWSVISTDVDGLIAKLRARDADGEPFFKYDKDRFLEVRAWDRDPGFEGRGPVERAARTLYLSKTCFNGLYRVNKSGQFNSPFGEYDNPRICDEENLRAVAEMLRGGRVEILNKDFEDAAAGAGPGDAVYLDPPYIPISDTSSFTAYTKGGFGLDDHRRLAAMMRRLVDSGVRTVLSNSAADMSRELFGSFDVDWFEAGRSVGGPADFKKQGVGEMIAFGGPR